MGKRHDPKPPVKDPKGVEQLAKWKNQAAALAVDLALAGKFMPPVHHERIEAAGRLINEAAQLLAGSETSSEKLTLAASA